MWKVGNVAVVQNLDTPHQCVYHRTGMEEVPPLKNSQIVEVVDIYENYALVKRVSDFETFAVKQKWLDSDLPLVTVEITDAEFYCPACERTLRCEPDTYYDVVVCPDCDIEYGISSLETV